MTQRKLTAIVADALAGANAVVLEDEDVREAIELMRGMTAEQRGVLVGRMDADIQEARKAGVVLETLMALAKVGLALTKAAA